MCVREMPYANCLPRMPLSALPLFVCVLRFFFGNTPWQVVQCRRDSQHNLARSHVYVAQSHTHSLAHSHLLEPHTRRREGTRWRRSRAEGSEPTDSAAWFLCAASASLAALPDRRRKVDSAQLLGTVGAIDIHSECL